VIGRRIYRTGNRGRGFTLMEVMLTMCLLVVIAALAWPALDKPFANQRLRKAADKIRAEWYGARVEALNSGLTHIFRYTIDGDSYRIERQAAPETPSDVAYDTTYDATTGQQSYAADLPATQGRLPEGVTFVVSETALDTRVATIESQSASVSSLEASWSDPILFYPDGTTSTARLVLRNQHSRCIELALRGLTGVVKVGELYTDEDVLR